MNFSHNKLTRIPDPFFRLRDLTTLNLSYNLFEELHPDISDLVMLETLVSDSVSPEDLLVGHSSNEILWVNDLPGRFA